ncbi:MAG TPA: extracellular solute-binding protein [Clostridia bacterium]|nr:extracellular solute-binding protein [Clostridia bacterium]
MKKRVLAVLLALSLAMAVFSGCSSAKGTENSGSNGTSSSAQKDVTLTFTYDQDGSHDPLEKWMSDKKVISRFEAENPGVHIKLVPISSTDGDYATLLALKLTSDRTAPDVFMEDTYMTATDAAAGHLACLDDYLSKWTDYSNYMDGAKAAVKGMDGKSYGVPISTDARGLFYNIDVLKKAGINTPWQPKTGNDILDKMELE